MLPTVWDTVPASTSAREWFADEIAIDFPAVDHAVERLREAFLGEQAQARTLTTEVLVSKHDATRGTVVPLAVPLRGTCVLCGGRGEIWTEPCRACGGTGDRLVHHPLRVALPPGVVHGARFRYRVNSPEAAPVRVEIRVAIRSSAA